jgi:O-antigen ligase
MKFLSVVSLIIAGIPLVIYPFVVLSFIWNLSAHWSGTRLGLLALIDLFCQLGSLIYPVIYLTCLATYLHKVKRQEERAGFRFSVAPLGVLILLIGMFSLYMRLEKSA